MIEKMTRYSFILLDEQRDGFLENLRELGIVDIKRSTKPIDDHSEAILEKISQIRKLIDSITNGRDATLVSLETERNEMEKLLSEIEPWGEFDMQKFKELGLSITFYCTNAKEFNDSWMEEYAIQKVSEINGKTLFVIVGSNEGFPLKSIPAPSAGLAETKAALDSKKAEIEAYAKSLDARKAEIPALEAEAAQLHSDLSLYLAGQAGTKAAENTIVTFEGFAPTENDAALQKAFDGMDGIFCMAEPAKEEDNPPIKLRNNRFSKLFECITGMYGMPVYGEWDPTPILSIFFLLFFAMCMGDAGYGLILIIYGILQDKKIVNIGMFDGLGKLIAVLGAATVVVGALFGTAFGIEFSKADWVPQAYKDIMITGSITLGKTTYAVQMVLAILIGIFHICLAMTIKAILYTKRFGIKNNISTWGWIILILGGIATAIIAMVGILPQNVIKIIIYVIAATSVLAIFIFNTPGRNPLINIGAGLWDTYNVATGILGDVLSYIRLYALGLAGGMLGGAFNNLGNMVLGANPTWQWLPYLAILLAGHVLNLLMACLGSFVHPLRLTFVEYFKNSGYEGKGCKYNPITK